jgi:CrcB protein
MKQIVAIALGGSLGAIMRFLVANGIYGLLGRGFPHGTLFVNISGSFLMGFLSTLLLQRFSIAVEYRAAIFIGFFGAYTTFSTFALETVNLFEEGSFLKACLNIFLSVVLCIVAVWFGLIWGRTLFANTIYPWLGHGISYRDMLLGLLATCLLSISTELTFLQINATPQVRIVVLILLLGLLTISSTLWLTFKLPEIKLEFQGLLSIFAINALCGVAMVWLGTFIGNWLWQHTLLR